MMRKTTFAGAALVLVLSSGASWADHAPGHDSVARGGVQALDQRVTDLETGLTAEEQARIAADATEAVARTAADATLQSAVNALEAETTLSDVGACSNGDVAKTNGAGVWSCAPDLSGGANTDTLAELNCTAEGDIAVFSGGQWVCESDLPPPPRFVDNGDGTVTDNVTGLMWEKKTGTVGTWVFCLTRTDCPDPHDVNNRYSWTDIADGDDTNQDGTLYTNFLRKLNDLEFPNDGTTTTCFADHCDWRIPTIGELRSILQAPHPDCTADPCIADGFPGPTQPSSYWSSTTIAGFYIVPSAWRVEFGSLVFFDGNGLVHGLNKTGNAHVRAVRNAR